MNIASIGRTGFVGTYLVDVFLEKGHGVALLVKAGSGSKPEGPDQWAIVTGRQS